MMDDNQDGVLSYDELISSIRSNKAVQEFMSGRPALSPLLRSQQIEATMRAVVGSRGKDEMTIHAFSMFVVAIGKDLDVSMSEEETKVLDNVDELFAILDLNNDGILSYSECAQGMSDDRVKKIVSNAPVLNDLLHPKELRRTMKKIAKSHPSGELNRGAFRLYVAVQSTTTTA